MGSVNRILRRFLVGLAVVLSVAFDAVAAPAVTTQPSAVNPTVEETTFAYDAGVVPACSDNALTGAEASGQAIPPLGLIAKTDAANNAAHSSANALRLRTQLAFEEAGILSRGGAGLTDEAIRTATEVPISGGRLINPAVVKELTSNGSNIADWGKFTTRTIDLPGGQRSPIHFYMNRVTKEVNLNIDFKVKTTIE